MEYLAALLPDAAVVVTLLVIVALALLALWCWAAAHNVKALDRELEIARIAGQMAILRSTGLVWYKEELYAELARSAGGNELFLAMQVIWPEDTLKITAKWAEDTDPDFQRELTNGKE